MKISKTPLLYAVFAIICLNIDFVKAKKAKRDLYDVQQFDNLDFEVQNFNFTDYTDPKSDIVMLKDRRCYVNDGFTPAHKDVSQIRVVFPTKSLKNVWGNTNYEIGFAVNCHNRMICMSNSNWYKFRQSNITLDNTKKYTSFSLDVGKCKRPPFNDHNDRGAHARIINTIEIIFKNGKNKSSMGEKQPRTKGPEFLEIPDYVECGHINNFIPIYILAIP